MKEVAQTIAVVVGCYIAIDQYNRWQARRAYKKAQRG